MILNNFLANEIKIALKLVIFYVKFISDLP